MKALIVEDEHRIARAIEKALEQEAFTVDVAFEGDEGYDLATTGTYDIIITDRVLPGAHDGLAIVKALRDARVHTPVILLSALGSIADRTEGLDAGADDYLVKPFALEELLARVRALLRRTTEPQSEILSVGDLSLNTVTYSVERAGTPIQLTGKEFALLEFLLRNPGRPLGKDTIISHVWDYDADVLPNTVEVYVKYLRNKVDIPFKKPLIHTVRGFGYKIEA